MTDDAAKIFQLFVKDARDVWKSHDTVRTRIELRRRDPAHLQNGDDLMTGAVTARPGPERIPFDITSGQPV